MQMTPEQSSSFRPPRRRTSTGMFFQLQVVFSVAFLVATLFTAWTEPGLLPGRLSDQLTLVLQQNSTEQAPMLTPTSLPNPRIGIVAGHSGNDSGAVCSEALGGFREVDINLEIANLVRESLIAEGYDVDLLAEFDPRLNGYRGLTLVSIHADSCEYVNEEATGFKVAAAMSTKYPEQATRLTNCMRVRYGEITGLHFHAGSVTNDMTYYHAFDEINNETPAAIIEVGFMNLDRKILTEQPDLLARGITAGILCYVRNEDVSTQPTAVP
ncbi:MAG: N-acetylmuramoyl-L-alanine amidase [Anaerolineales bacterium]|nr:N-acetylmuramoyl-L-alanine amidase [Anaerolineales bacterium]